MMYQLMNQLRNVLILQLHQLLSQKKMRKLSNQRQLQKKQLLALMVKSHVMKVIVSFVKQIVNQLLVLMIRLQMLMANVITGNNLYVPQKTTIKCVKKLYKLREKNLRQKVKYKVMLKLNLNALKVMGGPKFALLHYSQSNAKMDLLLMQTQAIATMAKNLHAQLMIKNSAI
jgi:hypothetical protein